MRGVRFERYGGTEVLDVVDVARPQATPGRVVVDVLAAAINPGEASIREGRLHQRFPATFPSGEGSDFAGVVTQLGEGVSSVALGDEVIGWSDERSSHAQAASVPAEQLVPKPTAVPWEVAGSLYVAGVTARATVRSVQLQARDVVAVSAAAGGVGSIAVQLARNLGAQVIGIAGPGNVSWLSSVGVIPVVHGEHLAAEIGAAALNGLDAFIDCFGGGYVELAVELGVDRQRIDTIIDRDAAQRFGARVDGMATVTDVGTVITGLAQDIAEGKLVVPIARTFPLEDVREAFALLEKRHVRGKVVLLPQPPA